MTSKVQTTADEDRIHREGVLMFLLQESGLVTIEEVVRHRQAWTLTERHEEIRDGTERAIADLAAVGALNVEGRSVYATRAAREVHRLVEGEESENCHASK